MAFQGLPVDIPVLSGPAVYGTVREVHAAMPWHSLVGSTLHLMPGVPMVFMGDELGLTGVDGEHARTPYPWHRRDEWDTETLAAYRSWIGAPSTPTRPCWCTSPVRPRRR